jgi:hypothetical protein
MIFGGGGGGGLLSYGCIHNPYGKRGAVSELRIQLFIYPRLRRCVFQYLVGQTTLW